MGGFLIAIRKRRSQDDATSSSTLEVKSLEACGSCTKWQTDGSMQIGELSRRLGISVPTLRYYESLGLLAPPARVSGRRRYDAEALNGLRLVLALKRSGFRLSEISRLMPLEARTRTREEWRAIARTKVAELDARIAKLRDARTALTSSLACDCEGRAEHCALVANTTGTLR